MSENYENQGFLHRVSIDVKSLEATFPWLVKFHKVMYSSVGSRNSKLLEHLLSLYTQNILSSINSYREQAFDMIRLKNHITRTLTFFHLYWRDMKEFVGDSDSYLNTMSLLLGVYIDMELKTFKHTKDSSSIVAKLLSALWIYLNHSERHIFRVILKLKHITKKCVRIYEPIIMKSFAILRRNIESLTDIEYIRYLLVLKMLKRTKETIEEMKEVNKMALIILGPQTPKMRDELLKILPKPSVGHENETLWLLQPNVFDLKAACSNFLTFEDLVSVQSKNSDATNCQKSQTISLYGVNVVEECNVNHKKKKKNSKRKLEWLKMMKKKCKVQKPVVRNKVKIADAHRTENSEKSVDKIILKYLPISDNKVSEHTESYASTEQDNIHDYIHNKKNKELKCMFQHKQCNNCILSFKQDDIQQNRILSLLKLLNVVGQNIREPKVTFREENLMSSQHMFICGDANSESSEINTQGKEKFLLQPSSSVQTILLSKECQNNITTTDTQSIKQELPTSTDCNIIESDCQSESVYVKNNYHSHDVRSLVTSKTAKQKSSCDIHECTCPVTVIAAEPFTCHNYNIINQTNCENILQAAAIDNNSSNKKSICNKSIVCMLNDLDKCMHVLNRIGEHIMTVHTEKQRLECLENSEVCAVTTTVFGDQSIKSGWNQNTNLLNSEKLSKFLELYGKRELLNVCSCTDIHRQENQDINKILNELKCEKLRPKDLHSCEKNHTFSETKLVEGSFYNHIKSEFEQSEKAVKKESVEAFGTITHQFEKMAANGQTDYFPYDPKNMDEFENIDILDSILNGDISMEDEQEILEDSQSLLMSPISCNNSNNVLNCITEFFSQVEYVHVNEKEDKYIPSNTKNSLTPLPEGSLGTTGILNSLLDFELTNMDTLPNDLMYSNVQTVNPRLIKKNFESDSLSRDRNTSELNSYTEETVMVGRSDEKDGLPQKKMESCNSKRDSVNSSVDVVGFGLNPSNKDVLQFSSINKKVSTDNISSELKDLLSKSSLSSPIDKLNTNIVTEKSYIFHKEYVNHVQSFSDTMNNVLPEICTFNDIPSDTVIHCVGQRNDKHTYMELESSPVRKQEPFDCELLFSTDLVAPNSITVSQSEPSMHENFLKKRNNIQKNIQHSQEEHNHTMKHQIEVSVQSGLLKRKLRYKNMKTENTEEESASPTKDESSVRCPQFNIINQDAQNMCELPLSSFHIYRQKSPQVCPSGNMYKQLKCVGIQQLRSMSPQKQQILLNFHGDSTMNTISKEDSKSEDSQRTIEDNIWEDATLLYESLRKSGNKTYLKLPKKGIKIDTDVAKINKDKCITEVSSNILIKSGIKWTLQNMDAKKQTILSTDEETP
ncbi:PREDICTED: uncharacterized protein LOC107190868 [Dufourea novaeangliae]|uniref:uncharacterized protein LOC107190868 n=1 Tax=Dufourea novaeangliae TaxID=178035 RepID=UPI0007674997|nr:PREDICTED: uncharacterized protein LOC107190868 [Dufourea novaeangliae]